MVPRAVIEPATRGTSHHRSTNELPRHCPACEPFKPVALRGLPDQERAAGLFTEPLIPDRRPALDGWPRLGVGLRPGR